MSVESLVHDGGAEQPDLVEFSLASLANGPRVTALADWFEQVAAGHLQAPARKVEPDAGWLRDQPVAQAVYRHLKGRVGTFFDHFYASVPFALENAIRNMGAIYLYSADLGFTVDNPLLFFEPGGGPGEHTRILPLVAENRIRALCSSATAANSVEFHRLKLSERSHFFEGRYFDVPRTLASNSDLSLFRGKFDVIYERDTFQMYHRDRVNQIRLMASILKENGILILEEKLLQEDPEEFRIRETLKDERFKPLYFDACQIAEKQTDVLDKMQMVTLGQLVQAIGRSFKYAFMFWNSTNFHGIAVSNARDNLERFLDLLIPPHVPAAFCFESDLPRPLRVRHDDMQ